MVHFYVISSIKTSQTIDAIGKWWNSAGAGEQDLKIPISSLIMVDKFVLYKDKMKKDVSLKTAQPTWSLSRRGSTLCGIIWLGLSSINKNICWPLYILMVGKRIQRTKQIHKFCWIPPILSAIWSKMTHNHHIGGSFSAKYAKCGFWRNQRKEVRPWERGKMRNGGIGRFG